MASKRTKGSGDEGAIIRRAKLVPSGKAPAVSESASEAAPAPAPRAAGRVLGSKMSRFAGSELKPTGADEFRTNGSWNKPRRGYYVTVEDDRLIFEGKDGERKVMDAPGVKGGQSGYVDAESMAIFKLANDGVYEVESSDNKLRFKQTDGGRVRDSFSLNLVPDDVSDRANKTRKKTADEQYQDLMWERDKLYPSIRKMRDALDKRERAIKEEEIARGHVTRDTIRARDRARQSLEKMTARLATLNDEGGKHYMRQANEGAARRAGA